MGGAFGTSLELRGAQLVISSPGGLDPASNVSGAVYVYELGPEDLEGRQSLIPMAKLRADGAMRLGGSPIDVAESGILATAQTADAHVIVFFPNHFALFRSSFED